MLKTAWVMLKYLFFYLACGVLAALTQWYFSESSGIPSLGASGAIAGVMGAYILRFPRSRDCNLNSLRLFLPRSANPRFLLSRVLVYPAGLLWRC